MRPAGILAYGAVSVLAYKLGLLVTEELKNREIREELRRLKSLPDDASAARVPRILLLYSDVGNGHQRAAEAVEEALHWQGAVEFEGGVITQATDILSFAPSDARSVYQSAYQSFVRSGGADRGYGSSRKDASHALQAATRKVMAQSLILKVVRLLHEFRPHVIINTHFLPAEVVAELASRYGLTTPQVGTRMVPRGLAAMSAPCGVLLAGQHPRLPRCYLLYPCRQAGCQRLSCHVLHPC
eukprot:jgi/Mesvir1/15953/Mv26461-RA.3